MDQNRQKSLKALRAQATADASKTPGSAHLFQQETKLSHNLSGGGGPNNPNLPFNTNRNPRSSRTVKATGETKYPESFGTATHPRTARNLQILSGGKLPK